MCTQPQGSITSRVKQGLRCKHMWWKKDLFISIEGTSDRACKDRDFWSLGPNCVAYFWFVILYIETESQISQGVSHTMRLTLISPNDWS